MLAGTSPGGFGGDDSEGRRFCGELFSGTSKPRYFFRLGCALLGGSFDNIGAGMTCQFSFISAEAEFRYGDLGFRCCSDTFPP